MARTIRSLSEAGTVNYGYRSIPVHTNRVSGTIAKGSVARKQRKGDAFVRNGQQVVVLNRVNGEIRSVTVLNPDGTAAARLGADASY